MPSQQIQIKSDEELLKMTIEMQEKDRTVTKLESSEVSLREEVDQLKIGELSDYIVYVHVYEFLT